MDLTTIGKSVRRLANAEQAYHLRRDSRQLLSSAFIMAVASLSSSARSQRLSAFKPGTKFSHYCDS
eukprot:697226-Pleurochrysis_carterae.AAC.1